MSRASTHTTPPDFRTRLVAFALVLVVGFVMGWANGRGGTGAADTSSGIVATQADAGETTEAAGQSHEQQSSPTAEDTRDGATDATSPDDATSSTTAPTRGPTVEEDGWYTSRDEVALYIHTYGHLPGNFISKTKARERGWVSSEGNLDEVCPGMSIGGSRFYNDEGQLPERSGRRWTECDINYTGGFRGAERIVFSNDGLIFYTGDHYRTFEQLY